MAFIYRELKLFLFKINFSNKKKIFFAFYKRKFVFFAVYISLTFEILMSFRVAIKYANKIPMQYGPTCTGVIMDNWKLFTDSLKQTNYSYLML